MKTYDITVSFITTNTKELFASELKIYHNPFMGELRITGAVVDTGRPVSTGTYANHQHRRRNRSSIWNICLRECTFFALKKTEMCGQEG